MPGMQVKRMIAGDPGVGFTLDLSGLTVVTGGSETSSTSINSTVPLEVNVQIYEPTRGANGTFTYPTEGNPQHVHSITIRRPTLIDGKAENLVFVIPFGASNYNDQKVIVNVIVKQNNTVILLDGFENEDGSSIEDGVSSMGIEVDGNPDKIFSYSLV